ncbi:MAG: PucR family transcriptional regulator [Christensenellales bacterium]
MDFSGVAFLKATLDRLSCQYYLLDAGGEAVLSSGGDSRKFSLDISWQKGPFARSEGFAFFQVDCSPRLYIAIEDRGEATVDAGLMAAAFVQSALSGAGRPMNKNEFFRRCVLGKVGRHQMQNLLSQFGVDDSRDRACIVLRDNNGIEEFSRMLFDAFSADSAETIVPVDKNTVCVVVSKTSDIALQDSAEFAAALEDTARELGNKNLLIGIGDTRRSMLKLSESYDEACRAIDMGQTFGLSGSVFIYKRMIMERIISEIPEDVCKKSYDMLFNRRNSRLLNEEMQRTISVFMECNLNLSEAARYIFIHRNTLVYRLDKIQTATGLDLRNFDDAATLRFIMLLGRRLGRGIGGEEMLE